MLGTLAFALLREPPPFLLARDKSEAARRSAAKVIDPAIELLPETVGANEDGTGESIGIFHPSNRLLNIGMVISFSATTTLVYGLLNWTTVLLTSAGFTLAQAQQAGVWQGILDVHRTHAGIKLYIDVNVAAVPSPSSHEYAWPATRVASSSQLGD